MATREKGMRGREAILVLDILLRKKGVHTGVPFGVGCEHLTTADPFLASMLQKIGNPKELDPGFVNRIRILLGLQKFLSKESYANLTNEVDKWKFVNQWKCRFHPKMHRPVQVFVIQHKDTGRAITYCDPHETDTEKRFKLFMSDMRLRSRCYSLESEQQAQERLKEALTDEQWQSYILSDAFLERGKSGVDYFLRKGRPTIAIRGKTKQVLGALCLHPYAYYTKTRVGALPPSDEVLAHLLMIRADEVYFWKKANVHSVDTAESGL